MKEDNVDISKRLEKIDIDDQIMLMQKNNSSEIP